jgi:hypothetical protein
MVLLLWGWRVGAWGLGLPARSASVCGLLLFERAKSVLRGSAMCELEGGGAAAAEEAPPWGRSEPLRIPSKQINIHTASRQAVEFHFSHSRHVFGDDRFRDSVSPS